MISDEDFIELCASGTPEEVTQALTNGADPNARDVHGFTALMQAAEKNSQPVVRALLAAGARVNDQDSIGWTPLMWAASWNALAVVQTLLASGADVNAQSGICRPALTHAVDFGMLSLAVQHYLAVNLSDMDAGDRFNGTTPLMWAAFANEFAVVEALLAAGADKSLKDKHGHDALWYALLRAQDGSTDHQNRQNIVRLLEADAVERS